MSVPLPFPVSPSRAAAEPLLDKAAVTAPSALGHPPPSSKPVPDPDPNPNVALFEASAVSLDRFDLPADIDIFEAARRGSLDLVSRIVEQGVNPSARDHENCTALHWAAIKNHLAVVKFLIEQGAEIDATGGELMATPLHWAARSGNVQVVTFLVNRGADPALQDNQGYNALHLAAHGGFPMMVLYLLAIGMDVDEGDGMGRTALMWTCYLGASLDALDALLRHGGARLDRVDSTGFSALHWAVISHHMAFAEALVRAGSPLDIRDPDGKSPADWAAERGLQDRFSEMLVECGKKKGRTRPFDQ
ncbi:Palmitoyltransferase Hip14, partial [Cladochytrium tenue]